MYAQDCFSGVCTRRNVEEGMVMEKRSRATGVEVLLIIVSVLMLPIFGFSKETAQQWEFLNPAGVVKVTPINLAQRIDKLEGKTVALKWNGKPNGNIFLDRIAELLKEKVPSAKIVKIYELEPTTVPQSATMDVADQKAKLIVKYKPDIVIGAQCD
jgi:hypothetical protein